MSDSLPSCRYACAGLASLVLGRYHREIAVSQSLSAKNGKWAYLPILSNSLGLLPFSMLTIAQGGTLYRQKYASSLWAAPAFCGICTPNSSITVLSLNTYVFSRQDVSMVRMLQSSLLSLLGPHFLSLYPQLIACFLSEKKEMN